MEKKLPSPVRLGLTFFLVLGVVSDQELVYFKKGSSITMNPNISETITSIEWRFGSDVVAEYIKDKIPLGYYDPFKGRASVDLQTGTLTINNMNGTLATKEYALELNRIILDKKFKAVELPELPKPRVKIQPLACSPLTHETCTRVCEVHSGTDPPSGTDTDPKFGPISYSWREDSGDWRDGERSMVFLKTETSGVKTFSCRAKSPVSLQESDPKDNPLYEPPPGPTPGQIGGGIVAAVAVVGGVVLAYWKRQEIQKLWSRIRGEPGPDSGPATSTGNGTGTTGNPEEMKGLTSTNNAEANKDASPPDP